MPALKLRIPNEDAPKYGDGNLSQLAKAKLLDALQATDWPRPTEPSSAMPATSVSVWLSNEQHAAVLALVEQHRIPGVEPMATALLHGWAQLQPVPIAIVHEAAIAAEDDQGVLLPPAQDEEVATPRHTSAQVAADLARKERDAITAAAIPVDEVPWDPPATPTEAPAVPSSTKTPRKKSANPASAPKNISLPTAPLAELPVMRGFPTTLDAINEALGNTTRQAQAVFFQRIHGELLNSHVLAPVISAEAATGIGKTRVFMAAMLDWTREHPDETAVLAAPSYNVLLQAVRVWQDLRNAMPGQIPDAVTLLGQQEFVSRWALERVLKSIGDDGDGAGLARRWMDDGGQPAVDDPLQHRWLMRGLIAATGGKWAYAPQSRLDTDTPADDPGRLAYDAQFNDAKETPWVFCTHAMLATDVRQRVISTRNEYKNEHGASVSAQQWKEWQARDAEERKGKLFWQEQNDLLRSLAEGEAGRLPPIGLLVVDEAHLLEENLARVFATGASIASMMRTLRQLRDEYPKQFQASEVKQISDIWDNLKAIGSSRVGESVLASELPAAGAAIAQVRKLLGGILKRKHAVADHHGHLVRQLRMVSRSLEVAAQSNGDRAGLTTRISWSPSAHWPSIEVGRYDISSELDFLWTCMVQDRSILVSATLYDDVAQSGLEGLRRLLALRSDRLIPLESVRPVWTTEPVTLYLPKEQVITDSNREHANFYRPWPKHTKDPRELEAWWQRWRKELSDYVLGAYLAGEGGMLVLMTSHQEREFLHQALEPLLDPGTLISQREGLALDAVKNQYLRVLASGKRPLLLAVGSAWTGLDLSGDALAGVTGTQTHPRDDQVLTDLVIANAPIGANRTLTHQSRRERNRSADFSATTILLRQGIGRLVRREGLPRRSRRLHFLDARLYDSAWNAYFNPIKRVLAPYISRKYI